MDIANFTIEQLESLLFRLHEQREYVLTNIQTATEVLNKKREEVAKTESSETEPEKAETEEDTE
jgi:hypothetical protein